MNKSLQVVTFEQAMKLKELGFDWGVDTVFMNYNGDHKKGANVIERYLKIENCNRDMGMTVRCSAPTTSLAIKWLRDEKKIFIHLKKSAEEYYFMKDEKTMLSSKEYDSYEKAESAGLDYALEYLILAILLNPKNNE